MKKGMNRDESDCVQPTGLVLEKSDRDFVGSFQEGKKDEADLNQGRLRHKKKMEIFLNYLESALCFLKRGDHERSAQTDLDD